MSVYLLIPIVAAIIYCFVWGEKLYRRHNPSLKHPKRAFYRRLIPFASFFAQGMNGVVYNRHNWELVHKMTPYLLGAAIISQIIVELINWRERLRDANSVASES